MNMDKYEKIIENVDKIIYIKGFDVTAEGDETINVEPKTWKIRNDFYFDNDIEINVFKEALKNAFEFYCGDSVTITTVT